MLDAHVELEADAGVDRAGRGRGWLAWPSLKTLSVSSEVCARFCTLRS
jgi:hypothetical protein